MALIFFNAFTQESLFGTNPIAFGTVFTLPAAPNTAFTVTDDDGSLSGDFMLNENADDPTQQTASILVGGLEVGNGGQIYAERTAEVSGGGNLFTLIDLEQEGNSAGWFAFLGASPTPGTMLTVGTIENVFDPIPYGDFATVTTVPSPSTAVLMGVALGVALLGQRASTLLRQLQPLPLAAR